MENVWQNFALKVAAWVAAAFALHFLTKIFLGGTPDFLIPAILAAGAMQIGLLDRTPLPAGNGKMLKRGVALLMITFAVWLGTNSDASGSGKIPWQSYSEEILEAARKSGRPVIIDFVSRACPQCKAMDRNVFSNDRVASAAAQFIALRVDLTDDTAASQALAARFGVEAFPTIVFLAADGKERSNLRLVGFENATFFAERLESAR
jgi:thiol:disulfide interchange protein DsbD